MFTFNQCSISAYISTKNLSQKEKVYKLLLWVFLEKIFFSVEGTANIGGDAHFVLKLGGVDVIENTYEDLKNASETFMERQKPSIPYYQRDLEKDFLR